MAEPKIRISYDRWGGVAGWMKLKIRLSSASKGMDLGLAELGNKTKFDQLGLELGLNLILEAWQYNEKDQILKVSTILQISSQ